MYAVRRFNCCPIRRVYATLRKPCSRHSSPAKPSARTSSSWRSIPIPNTCCPIRSKRSRQPNSWLKWASWYCRTFRPAPIGTNKGLVTRDLLAIIIEQSNVPVIVDAGLGAPSHAAAAMEMGADAVLVNTAIAVAGDPVRMARAFAQAVVAGREAYEAGLGAQAQCAEASSPLTAFLD